MNKGDWFLVFWFSCSILGCLDLVIQSIPELSKFIKENRSDEIFMGFLASLLMILVGIAFGPVMIFAALDSSDWSLEHYRIFKPLGIYVLYFLPVLSLGLLWIL